MMRWTPRFVICAAALVAGSLVVRADDKVASGDAQLQFQLGNLLSEETRFREALDAYDKAIQTDDQPLQVRARAGKVKIELALMGALGLVQPVRGGPPTRVSSRRTGLGSG